MTSASTRRRGTRPSAAVQGPSADMSFSIRDEIEERIRRFSEANTGHQTPVPGLIVGRLTAPVPPTIHIDGPCLCVCIRGQRKISVGETSVFQNENQLFLTAIDRPAVYAIPHASLQKPYTALRIDIDLDVARQIMAHIDVNECAVAPSQSELTAPVTPELLDCVLRLTRLIERPSEIAVFGRPDTPGDSLPLAFGAGRQQSSADCARRLARATGLEGSGMAEGALPKAIAHRSTCEEDRDGSIHAPSAFSRANGYESDSVSEATALARSASIDA
jgi:hypothetical protein